MKAKGSRKKKKPGRTKTNQEKTIYGKKSRTGKKESKRHAGTKTGEKAACMLIVVRVGGAFNLYGSEGPSQTIRILLIVVLKIGLQFIRV